MIKQLILANKRDASLKRRHPWIFSGAVQKVEGDPQPGETVEIRGADMTWLARGSYSPDSQIRARVWTFDAAEKIDREFFVRKFAAAKAYREQLGLWQQDACRLVHGEADGVPALVVDKYGPYLCCQFLSCGVEYWRDEIVAALAELPGIRGIYERSDAESRKREGLPLRDGLLFGEAPPQDFTIVENGLRLRLDVCDGHKTGYYLDQRENRLAVDDLAAGADVLDCCCYSGAFGIRSAKAGAKSVLFLDGADAAIQLAQANAALNGLADDQRLTFMKDDMFTRLRKFRDARMSFDLIILDPPKFAKTKAQLPKAAHGYKDINLLACKLLRPNGTLLTFSCSAAMTPEFFRTIVAEALCDAKRSARVVRDFRQAPDHPASLAFPEGDYLNGLMIRMAD
ncbi:MAG: class I SAM-dependent methyltransferase [Victivallales bacterium]|nr:class I SAM-dependent methyltransferase [Victivallales bacterium]